MGIKIVPQPPYSPDFATCDFWLYPKLCRYETIEDMKEAVTKVIDTLIQEDFHGAFQKLLEWYNKCIAARGDYFEGDYSFMCVLSIKVPIRKKSGNLFKDPRMCNWAAVLENETHKLLWDFDIQTDHLLSPRRTDIIVINKQTNKQKTKKNKRIVLWKTVKE